MWWGQFPIPKWIWWAIHPRLLLETIWEDYPVVRLATWSVFAGAILGIIVWLNT